MTQRVFAIGVVTLLGLFCPAEADLVTFPGIVSLDTVEVSPGSHFGVSVRLSGNSLGIVGLELPLKFESPHLRADSVSFVGSVKPAGMKAVSCLDNVSDTLAIMCFPEPMVYPLPVITASDGVIATVYFTLAGDAESGVIPIDSVFHGPGTLRRSGVSFCDSQAMDTYLPQAFIGGAVVVLAPTGVDDQTENEALPTAHGLAQNYPNPFNPTTVIELFVPKSSRVKLEVFNVLGQSIATVLDKQLDAGIHQVVFDGSGQPSGIYFYRMTHSEGTETKKMILVK